MLFWCHVLTIILSFTLRSHEDISEKYDYLSKKMIRDLGTFESSVTSVAEVSELLSTPQPISPLTP